MLLDCRDLFVEHCQRGHAFAADDIRTLECQFSRLVGTPVVVMYNAKTEQRGELNMRACRLSTDIATGAHTKVRDMVSSRYDPTQQVSTECINVYRYMDMYWSFRQKIVCQK